MSDRVVRLTDDLVAVIEPVKLPSMPSEWVGEVRTVGNGVVLEVVEGPGNHHARYPVTFGATYEAVLEKLRERAASITVRH